MDLVTGGSKNTNKNKNKRKGSDIDHSLLPETRSVVVISPHAMNSSSNSNRMLLECKSRFDYILQLCNSDANDEAAHHDANSMAAARFMLEKLQQKTSIAQDAEFRAKLARGDALHQALQQQIAATQVRVHNESNAAAALVEQHETLLRNARDVQQQMAAVDQQRAVLSKETEQFRYIADTECATSISSTRRQRAHQVPRLQQQLSLYATITGIKWDFAAAQEESSNSLVGEAVRTPVFIACVCVRVS
jgi:hypothetical protein